MGDITIRRATTGDIPAMSELFQMTLKKVNSRDYTTQQVEAWGKKANEARWRELFAGDLMYILAESENRKLMGFASVNANGYIHSMFVSHFCQHKGVATSLLEEIERLAGLNGVKILTSDVSITARPFFEKYGFCVVRENTVDIGGVGLINYSMEKYFCNR